MKHLLKLLLVIANIGVGAALVISALSTLFDAQEHPRIVIAAMSFPVWVPPAVAILILDFFAMRKWCLWMAICIGCSLPMIFTVYPVNIKRGAVPEELQPKSWTLLSYNISQFIDVRSEKRDTTYETLKYILDKDADVVVLVEAAGNLKNPKLNIKHAFVEILRERYPYVLLNTDIALLSKFPADTVQLAEFPLQQYKNSSGNSKAGCWIVDIHGEKTAIFGLHLKSLGLTDDDKFLYEEFTRGEGLTSRAEISEAKNDLIGKVAKANQIRAEQMQPLLDAINEIGVSNVIVCGDFNDTPGCYALTKLEEDGFREVYPLVGNGYMNTFNRSRLLFQIDHILFRGSMRPWAIERGDLKTSDHYPLFATFIQD